MTSSEPKNISPLAKWLAAGISAFMLAYGLFIITTEHYYGYSSKFGGAEVSVDGLQTIMNGTAIIFMGLTPMSLWTKSAKAAGFWAGTCMIIGVILFLAPVYIH